MMTVSSLSCYMPHVSGDLPQITAPLAWRIGCDGLYCQERIKGSLSHTLLRADGWDSSAGSFSVMVLNMSVLSRISTKRHKSLSLQALFLGLMA